MTFNKMRFPIVWITLALCVVLCAIEVHSGPVAQDSRLAAKDQRARSARQEPYNEDSGEENDDGSEEEDEDGGGDEEDDEDEEERRFKRDAAQKPLPVNEEQPAADEDSVIPSTDAPSNEKPTKKPSVLLMLSNALDKAIAVTQKLPAPSQQIASDAASVFLLLGQVFTEAIDKVIGDDGPEESATEIIGDAESATTVIPSDEQLTQLPIQPVKVEKQPEINSSQSGIVFPEAS